MDKKQLLAYPVLEEITYREPHSSYKINKILKSIEESVLRAMLKSSEVVNNLNALNLAVASSYRALSGHDSKFNRYPDNMSGVIFATAFDKVLGENNQNYGHVDNMAGILTLDWNSSKKMSKIPTIDGIASPSIDIYVDGILRDRNDSVYNCISKKNNLFWIEQTNTAEHTLELRLPPTINNKFNYLELVPMPLFGIDITRITYFDYQSREVDIYPKIDNKFYNGSGPLVFHMNPVEYNNTIKIYYTVKDNVGCMGFSNIDVALIDYYNTEQTAYMAFNIPNSVTNIFPTELSLDFYVSNTTEYSNFITDLAIVNSIGGENLITLKPTTNKQYFNYNTIPVTNGLYLKLKIKEINMTTPVIRGCQLKYKEV